MRLTGGFLIVLVLTVLSGCYCKSVAPISSVKVALVDSFGHDLIDSIYTEATYHLTSDDGDSQQVSVNYLEGKPLLRLFFGNLRSGINYYIHLSDTDVDTVSLTYTTEAQRCHASYNLTEFKYNGVVYDYQLGTTDYVEIIK